MGAGLWWLGLLAVIPLSLPLKGVLGGSIRSITWAGYLLIFYGVVGIMEAWSNPPQRMLALIQIALVVLCLLGMLRFNPAKR